MSDTATDTSGGTAVEETAPPTHREAMLEKIAAHDGPDSIPGWDSLGHMQLVAAIEKAATNLESMQQRVPVGWLNVFDRIRAMHKSGSSGGGSKQPSSASRCSPSSGEGRWCSRQILVNRNYGSAGFMPSMPCYRSQLYCVIQKKRRGADFIGG